MLKRVVTIVALTLAWVLGGSAFAAAIVLEAESGILTGTTVTAAVAGYSGSGYVTGFDNTGDSVPASASVSARRTARKALMPR
jgi:mannan endo-1,4-beta-mannosidase